jgi:hypothetical protein
MVQPMKTKKPYPRSGDKVKVKKGPYRGEIAVLKRRTQEYDIQRDEQRPAWVASVTSEQGDTLVFEDEL